MSERRILVTGGTGFIGRALCTRLLAEGWGVDVLTRDAGCARKLLPESVGVVESAHELPAPPHGMVGLAGENLGVKRWNEARKREFVASRVRTTEHLVEYAAACGSDAPRVLVNGSAVGYYGARGDEEVDEGEPPGDEYQSELCRQWEAAAVAARDHGVRVCLIRPGAVLDAGGGPLQSMLPAFRFGMGAWLGNGRQWLPWIHRMDLVRAILFLIENHDCSGPYNTVAPHAVTHRTFSKALGRALRRPVWAGMPAPVVRLMFGEMADMLLTGQRVVPRRLKEAGFEFRFPDLDAALAEIVDGG